MDAYNKKNLVKIMSHLAQSKCATLACLKLKIQKNIQLCRPMDFYNFNTAVTG